MVQHKVIVPDRAQLLMMAFVNESRDFRQLKLSRWLCCTHSHTQSHLVVELRHWGVRKPPVHVVHVLARAHRLQCIPLLPLVPNAKGHQERRAVDCKALGSERTWPRIGLLSTASIPTDCKALCALILHRRTASDFGLYFIIMFIKKYSNSANWFSALILFL